jgi:hypothetical protein
LLVSYEMEKTFQALLNLGDQRHPEFVLWAGSAEAANKWDQLIHRLAEEAHDAAETSYELSGRRSPAATGSL